MKAERSVFLSLAPRQWALGCCLAALVGRAGLDQVGLGEQWQRLVELASAVLVGAVVVQFSADDPPRRPWAALFVSMLIVPIARFSTWIGWTIAEVQVRNLLFIVGNLILAGSVIGFARVLGGSELLSDRTGVARVRASVTVSAIAGAALIFIGYNIVELISRGPPTTRDGWASAVTNAVSCFSDGMMFAGGLYLVWLLRPLIGGILALPYVMMALAGALFLVLDVLLIGLGAVAQTDVANTAVHLLGTLAYASFGAAAVVQLRLLRSARAA